MQTNINNYYSVVRKGFVCMCGRGKWEEGVGVENKLYLTSLSVTLSPWLMPFDVGNKTPKPINFQETSLLVSYIFLFFFLFSFFLSLIRT
jgi:hypothetical protein